MRGSLAVWYEGADDPVHGFKPHVQLHFNIWKDLPDGIDVFDFGILFKEIRSVSAFNIFIPGDFESHDIEDLSDIMRDNSTLRAVFNDTVHVGRLCIREDVGFDVIDDDNKRLLFFLRIPAGGLDVEKIGETQVEGTVIRFGRSLLDAMAERIGDHYIRLRLRLKGGLSSIFGERIVPDDSAFVSSFSTVDSVEFRINERRNLSEQLLSRHGRLTFPQVSSINYFLVRHIRTDIIRSHEAFRRMRLLEPELWNRYLASLGKIQANKFAIYQWRAGGALNSDVDGFIALSFFRRTYALIVWYVLIAIIVGALGSTVSSLFVLIFHDISSSSMQTASPLDYVYVCIALAISLCAIVSFIRHRVKKM